MDNTFLIAINHEKTDREVRVANVAVDFNRCTKQLDSRYWLAYSGFAIMRQVTVFCCAMKASNESAVLIS